MGERERRGEMIPEKCASHHSDQSERDKTENRETVSKDNGV